MNKLSIFAVLAFALISFPPIVDAKVLPQAQKQTGSTNKSYTAGLTVYPRLRGDRRALLISFGNLKSTTSVSYSLIYSQNGQQEGAVGGVSPSEGSATREALFGTCSKNVCRYHSNITNARLEVSYTSTSGKKYLKRYKIKV